MAQIPVGAPSTEKEPVIAHSVQEAIDLIIADPTARCGINEPMTSCGVVMIYMENGARSRRQDQANLTATKTRNPQFFAHKLNLFPKVGNIDITASIHVSNPVGLGDRIEVSASFEREDHLSGELTSGTVRVGSIVQDTRTLSMSTGARVNDEVFGFLTMAIEELTDIRIVPAEQIQDSRE